MKLSQYFNLSRYQSRRVCIPKMTERGIISLPVMPHNDRDQPSPQSYNRSGLYIGNNCIISHQWAAIRNNVLYRDTSLLLYSCRRINEIYQTLRTCNCNVCPLYSISLRILGNVLHYVNCITLYFSVVYSTSNRQLNRRESHDRPY